MVGDMGAGKNLTDWEKSEIDGLTAAGWTQGCIAKHIDRDKKAVYNEQQLSKSRKLKPKLRKPPKLSDRDTRALVIKAREGNFSARNLVFIARNDYKVDIGIRRMQKILQNADYSEYTKMLKAPGLSIDNKKKRFAWALKYMKKLPTFWQSVVFSDEKRFCLNGPDGEAYYWADTRLEKRYFSTRARGDAGLMVWATISVKGKSEIVFLDGNLNSQAYTNMLATHLLPFLENCHGGEDDMVILPQENAPAHSSRHTSEWFMDNDIAFLDWPAKSPDLNVIENAWGASVREVYYNYRQFDYLDDLKDGIITAWDKLTQSYINNLIESMSARCGNVVLKRGNPTKY